jgi:kynurenine formamidase
MPEESALELMQRCSNRGRWGPDDELGTLNFITAEKRLSAFGLVRSGASVSIGRDLDVTYSSRNPNPVVHRMLYVDAGDPPGAIDMIEIAPHGHSVTHVDAVAHVYFEGSIYNGRRVEGVVSPRGLSFGSIMASRGGVITRGVLLDVAAARGVPSLEPGEAIWPEDLESAERFAGLTVGRGDAVIVRSGVRDHDGVGESKPMRRTGLAAECLFWLHDREVAVYSGDCSEVVPSPYERLTSPLHQIGLAAMGLTVLDVPDLAELTEVCHRTERYEFLFLYAPLRLPGGTGSPVNPLCVF